MDDAGELIGGFDRRLTRQEEWGRLTDGRTTRLEDKMDRLIEEMAIFRAEIRSEIRNNLVSREDLDARFRHSQNVTWAAAAAIVALISLVVALSQVLAPALGRAPAAAPVPVVVQVPTPTVR